MTPKRSADAAMVVHAISVGARTGGGPLGGDTVTATTARGDAVWPTRGKERAFEGSAIVRNGGSTVVAAARGSRVAIQSQGGPKAPRAGEREERRAPAT